MNEANTAPRSGEDRRQARRAIVAATVGNALELYDFMVFTFFAIQIGQAFFPSEDPVAQLMYSLATFGIGFISRPLGAWIIGGYGDRHGRRPALMLSMILMGVAIAVMALTPGYAAIGAAAPVIVVLARLAQGFALGGEVGPATAYLMENATDARRGLVVSMQRVSQLVAITAGSLVGLILSLVLPPDTFTEYGWRIAMLIGVVIVPYAMVIRRRLPETRHVEEAPSPVTTAPTNGVRPIYIIGPILMAAGTVGAYVSTYLATFGQARLEFSASVALGAQVLANMVALAACIASGWISDHTGRKPALLWIIAAQIVLIPLSVAWMVGQPSMLTFFAGSIMLAAAAGAFPTPANTAIIESLPKAGRSRGFALIYTVPVTLFGATTQLHVTWLIDVTGDDMMVAWFPLAAMVFAFVATLALRESAPGRLTRSV
jgi:MHS family citrate/tricarballylate:H+ symporter-like MFS transporter